MKRKLIPVMAIAMALTQGAQAQIPWYTPGNAGTNPAINFVGTTDAQPLNFRTNNQPRMQIDVNGKLAIGTTPTTYAFDILTGVNAGQLPPRFRFERNDGSNQSNSLILGFSSNMFTGTGIGAGSAAFMLSNPYNVCDMAFSTNTAAPQLLIRPSGNVGINTTLPLQKLHVHDGGILVSGATPGYGGPQVIFTDNLATHPGGRWAIEYQTTASSRPSMGGLNFWKPSSATSPLGNYFLFLKDDGKVGMGVGDDTGDPNFCAGALPGNYRLYVNGGILTTGVKVANYCSAAWADHVFADNYNLRPLADVAHFIKQHQHLPGIPSARELEKEGLDLVKMQSLQMEKIEELTLYIIQLKNEIEQLKPASSSPVKN